MQAFSLFSVLFLALIVYHKMAFNAVISRLSAIYNHREQTLISLMIFEEDGVPVGFANLMTIYSVWTHGKALILDDLYLRPVVRGKGYGKQALDFIEEFAVKRGCKRLQFQSEVTNPNAMEFYISQGYSKMDAIKACAADRNVPKSVIYKEFI